MNTQTDLVRFTHQKLTIIKMVILTLLMTINLVTMDPIAADAAPAGRSSGPAASPDLSAENYQFSKTEVHELFWHMGFPRGADYPGIGIAKSCHPVPEVRRAVAEKKAFQKAVQDLDAAFGCDYYWENEGGRLQSCEEECSDPYVWAERGLLNPANGDEVVEVLGDAESSEIRVRLTHSTTARGCHYAEALAQDYCGCDCEAKIRYPLNP